MSKIQQLLTDHIDIWTAADTGKKSGRGRSANNAASVYGISKLRELILELAVRGKLVPQDANDEPARELLKRIQAEKAKLIAEGKIKNDKPFPPISDIEKPFELTQGWAWIRLNELLKKIGAGSTPLGGKQVYLNEGIPFLRSQNVWDEGLRLDDVAFISPETHLKMSGTQVCAGDLLFNITGASIGRCAIVPESFETGNVSQHVTIVRSVSKEILLFLHLVLISRHVQQTVMDVQVGVSREGLSIGKLGQFIIPIPPLAEQHRIVAKVDELMALCDQLEAQHNNVTEAHEKLVSHLLGTLTQSQSAEDFSANWQRIAAHFDSLFTTDSSIDALKQTLLQLAVMGKLVPQDPNDEHASELLRRIQAEKAKLIAEGKIKKDKPLPPIAGEEKPFELPLGWAWARFPELGEFGRGKSKHRPRNDPKLFNPGIYPLVQTGEVARADNVIDEYHSKYSDVGLAQSKMWPAGTLCITIAANIADSAILGFDACFPDSVVGFVPGEPLIDTRYFLVFMKTARENLLKFAPATAQKNINLEILESVLIPLPALKEISRIVATVDALVVLCDQMKARIGYAMQLQRKLADVMVEQAVV